MVDALQNLSVKDRNYSRRKESIFCANPRKKPDKTVLSYKLISYLLESSQSETSLLSKNEVTTLLDCDNGVIGLIYTITARKRTGRKTGIALKTQPANIFVSQRIAKTIQTRIDKRGRHGAGPKFLFLKINLLSY